MSVAILATKLYAPLARAEITYRPRLIAKLNKGLGCKLSLTFGFCATIFPPGIQPRFAPVPFLTNSWLAQSNIEKIALVYPIPYIEGNPILYPF